MPGNGRSHAEETPLLHSQTSTAEPQIEINDVQTKFDATNPPVTTLRGTAIFLSLFTLVFLQAANTSLMTTMQSTVARDLDAYSSTSWFTSAYLIPMSSLAPLTGNLAQLFSPRQIIYASTATFSLGHLVASQAPGLSTFLAGRAITGAGAAGILALSIVLALELTAKKRRGLCIGLLNAGFSLGMSLGAVVAGGLTPHIGWRAVFFMQVPLTVVGGTCLAFSIPDSFEYRKNDTGTQTVLEKLAQVDFSGALALTSFIVILLVGLSSPKISIIQTVSSLFFLAIFIDVELRLASMPIVPVTLLKSRGALLTCLATLGVQMSRWTVIFYTPIYAMAVRGWSPASAGSILIPTNAGFALGGLVVGFIHIRRKGSFYIASITAYILFPLTSLLLAHFSTPSPPAWLYIILTFLNGFVTGAGVNYTLAHILHLTPSSTHFVITSLIATFRGLAGGFGSAAGGSVFVRLLRSSLEKGFEADGGLAEARRELVRKLLGSPAMVWELDGVEKAIAVEGYVNAIRGVFVAASILAAAMVVVQAGTGWRSPKEESGGEENRGWIGECLN